jgi:hypothetical protein
MSMRLRLHFLTTYTEQWKNIAAPSNMVDTIAAD